MGYSWFTDPPGAVTGDADSAYFECIDNLVSNSTDVAESDFELYGKRLHVGEAQSLIELLLEGERKPSYAVFSPNGLVGTVKYSDSHPRIFCSINGDQIDDAQAALLISKASPHPALVSCIRAQQDERTDIHYNLLSAITELWAIDMQDVSQVVEQWAKHYDWYHRWGVRCADHGAKTIIRTELEITSPIVVYGVGVFSRLFWSDCTTLTTLVIAGEKQMNSITLSSNGRVGIFCNRHSETRQFVAVTREYSAAVITEEQAMAMLRDEADQPAIHGSPDKFSSRAARFGSLLTWVDRTYPVKELVGEYWGGSSSWKKTFHSLANPRYHKL